MQSNSGYYARIKDLRKDEPALAECIRRTVEQLCRQETDAHRPGILLGHIQSGKTRAFLGIIAAAFDQGFDVAVVLTKGTKTLAKQTVRRLAADFRTFREENRVDVFDILELPDLTPWEISQKKLIFVAKKEANNMRRLLKLFQDTHSELSGMRVLIIDDEADFASVRFTKKRGAQDIEQGRIAEQIDELRRTLVRGAFLQVTATPYSLYLQPEEYAARDGANFTFEPRRPTFTELLPVYTAYVGGEQYFGTHDPTVPEFYLWHEVHQDELMTLRKEDQRRLKLDQCLTSEKVRSLRHALVTFVAGACIRRRQQREAGEPEKNYAMIVHIETSRSSHAWQHTVADEIIKAMRDAIKQRDPIFGQVVRESTDDLERSVTVANLPFPSREIIVEDVRDAFMKGGVMTTRVNSDNEVEKLLDDNAELRLRTPFNVFIGGQILDRGITVPNLIGFYYGRSPKRMQQDTVLQHSRMYGFRPPADLAVTRFYTTADNEAALKRIYEFDSALRYAFEMGAHDRGVAFVQKDALNRIIPCAPNKILLSDIVAIRPGGRLLPVGFDTGPGIKRVPADKAINRIIDDAGIVDGEAKKVRTDDVIRTIDEIDKTLEFDPGYAFDWNALKAAVEYFSRVAAPDSDKGYCWVYADRGRKIARRRAEGRFSDAPDGHQEADLARKFGRRLPFVCLLQQQGQVEDGWKGHQFWWPVLYAPQEAAPSIFTSSPSSRDHEEETAEEQ